MRVASPLTLLFANKDVRTTLAVMQTGATSSVLKDVTDSPSPSTDPKGPFTVMALSTWTQSSTTGTEVAAKSNLLVSGSYEIMDQDLLQASNKNNAKDLLGIADTLMTKAPSINIPNKTYDSNQLQYLKGQDYVIGIIFLLILPLVILALGLFQYLRRRHL